MFAAWYALFGLILGSFANVVILREETGETLSGRSHCAKCGRTLVWYELFPVVSFLVLRGACRTCKASVSLQYPLVEFITGLGVLVLGLAPIALTQKVISIPIFVLLICIAVYDLRTTYIPDRWAYSFAGLAFVYGAIASLQGGNVAIPLFLISGPLVAMPLFALWAVSRGTWMGFGDVKLVLGFGWLLGIVLGYVALGLAFVTGAVVGLILIGISRLGKRGEALTMKSEVPFGPFLIISVCIIWFSHVYGIDILHILADFLSLS